MQREVPVVRVILRSYKPVLACRDLKVGGASMGLTMVHESWTNRVFSTHFPSSGSRVSSLRGTLPWRLPPTRVFLLGPVLMYGFRTVHLSRELARYRSMFAVFA